MEIGKKYLVNHSRKGQFVMKVESIDETWVSGVITNGRATAILKENEIEQGEDITVRKSLASFSEIT